jgi:hypothetical protein
MASVEVSDFQILLEELIIQSQNEDWKVCPVIAVMCLKSAVHAYNVLESFE